MKAKKIHNPKEFNIEINPEEPLFIIGVASEMVEIPIWTLRRLDEMGVVKPKRIGKKTRCYSKEQVKQLNYIYYLMQEKGVTISNVKVFIEMNISRK